MKKLMFWLVMAGAVATFGAANDLTIMFSSKGPDRYADGTVVKDGECYALVWTKTGTAFAGFAADGTVVDGVNSAVLLTAPIARDGKCPTVVFELDAALAEKYVGGSFGVYLLDTRDARGRVMGVGADGRAKAVNGYGATAETSEAGTVAEAGPMKSVASEGCVRVTAVSAVPADAPRPRIKSIKVEGGYVYVTVANTVPYLQYGLSEGKTPSALTISSETSPVQGESSGDVILVSPAKGGSGFFRVTRR